MNVDLEEQLDAMGPEYRAVVARLRMARTAESERPRRIFRVFRSKAALIAASSAVLIGLSVFFQPSRTSGMRVPREYRASVAEMIASQNADGSWTSDFLTRRNAATLKQCSDPAARIAYKKALRYLHAKGLAPLRG